MDPAPFVAETSEPEQGWTGWMKGGMYDEEVFILVCLVTVVRML